MSKRIETLLLEKALSQECYCKRIYGCEEVTIGFCRNGHGDEIVDFISIDCKEDIRCYEIKITLQDLKSKAKKSWYGDLNYLVVSKDLHDKILDYRHYIPDDIGVIVGNIFNNEIATLKIIRRPKRKKISKECKEMLKMSMIRSMYWKMHKYKEICDEGNDKRLRKEIRDLKKELSSIEKELNDNIMALHKIKSAMQDKSNIRFSLSSMTDLFFQDDFLKNN